MDCTVVGDTVNLASRLEGLTKYYSQPLIISSTVQERVADTVPCRLIDTVVVKGKTVGERIYTARNTLSSAEEEAWSIHAQAMDLFYGREFRKAERLFRKVLKILPGDPAAEMFLQRAKELATAPPGEDWTGATIMSQK